MLGQTGNGIRRATTLVASAMPVVHLEDGSIVCYLAEVVLAEIKGVQLTRIRNEYGIPLLEQKE